MSNIIHTEPNMPSILLEACMDEYTLAILECISQDYIQPYHMESNFIHESLQ